MKKFTAIIISAIVLLSACVFGGCSDFSFNPIGGWIFTDEYLFVDGKELGHINQQEMQYKETKYTFEKSGTGYITVDGYRTIDFTYTYTDDSVDMTMSVPQPTIREISVKYVDVHYRLEAPKDGSNMKLIRTEEQDAENDDGTISHLRGEYVLTRV